MTVSYLKNIGSTSLDNKSSSWMTKLVPFSSQDTMCDIPRDSVDASICASLSGKEGLTFANDSGELRAVIISVYP